MVKSLRKANLDYVSDVCDSTDPIGVRLGSVEYKMEHIFFQRELSSD